MTDDDVAAEPERRFTARLDTAAQHAATAAPVATPIYFAVATTILMT